jgi:hypothetical protein
LKSSPLSLAPLSEILRPTKKLSAAEQFSEKDFDPIEHDFEDVFLAHAKLYVLASSLEIEALSTLVSQRILRTLLNIGSVQQDSSVPANFVKLARYTYARTDNTGDPLREIVSHFAALNFTALQTQDMDSLIGEGGNFAKDLMAKVNIRLISTEMDVKNIKLRASSEREEIRVDDRDVPESERRTRDIIKRGIRGRSLAALVCPR